MMNDRTYWHTCIRCSQKSLAKFLKAIIYCNGQITDSCCIGLINYPLDKMTGWWTTDFAINIPEGREKEFEKLSGATLEIPPKIMVN